MSRRLIVRPEAEAEMADAFDWYEDRVPGLGSQFLLCVDAVFSAILRSPQQFPRVHRVVRRALTRRYPTKCSLWKTTSAWSFCRSFMPSGTRNAGKRESEEASNKRLQHYGAKPRRG